VALEYTGPYLLPSFDLEYEKTVFFKPFEPFSCLGQWLCPTNPRVRN